jgi:hypothetical protein
MATESPFANLGLEFMRWQNVPSISETIIGGKSPILKTIGLLLGGNGEKGSEEGGQPAGLGQGVAPPTVPGGVGMNPNAPSGVGIPPSQFKLPGMTLPQLGTAPSAQPGVDVDGDGQIDNFWGIKK